MDKKVEILLGSEKNVNSVNVDNYEKIELTNNVSELNEFTVNDVVNSTEVFDAEREENQVYRLYGRIEYMSLLNGLKTNYSVLEDFFTLQYSGNSKNLINSFDFYLVAPSSGTTGYTRIINTNYYKRNFDVIAGLNDIEIYDAGFSNNIYGEQIYGFSFKSDFDVSEYYDELGFPLTELFLYAQYKKDVIKNEAMSYTVWSTTTGISTKTILNPKELVIGDNIETQSGDGIYDIVEYVSGEYFQEQVYPQEFYIRTPYTDGGTKWLEWTYNPFTSFRLRYLDGVVSTAKLAEIVESGSTLDIYIVDTPSEKINVTKTLGQTLTEINSSITDWDDSSPSASYNWTPSTGEIEFYSSSTYNIQFKTQIYLPTGTDKYIGQTYLQENTGSGWVSISETTRKFLITNSTQGVNITKTYNNGDKIRVRTQLIPNPDKRTMFEIPDYAKMIYEKGKYVWRDILPQGYVDPITNNGVDYPFFNKKRYLFSPVVFNVIPNLEHTNTQNVFSEISYTQYASILDLTPTNDLDNIGKPCQ